MAEANYRVVLTGDVLDDYSTEDVAQTAAKLFKCSAEKAQKLLAHKQTPLKRIMDQTTAERYRTSLNKAGIDCKVVPIKQAQPSMTLEVVNDTKPIETTPPTTQTPTTTNIASFAIDDSEPQDNVISFTCPKCQTPQAKELECVKCGIIFSKYREPIQSVSETTTEETKEMKRTDAIKQLELIEFFYVGLRDKCTSAKSKEKMVKRLMALSEAKKALQTS